MSKNESYAPIVLFAFNRPIHTFKTLTALRDNALSEMSDLFIFIDGPRNEREKEVVDEVLKIAKDIEGFNKKNIIKADSNKGLANSVIEGVSQVVDIYKKVIVLEDDLITSPYFLSFMNEALDFYSENKKIWSISGYTPKIKIPKDYHDSIYLTNRGSSWGWATWKDRWDTIDWDIKEYEKFIKDKRLMRKFNASGNDMSWMLKDQMSGYIDSWAIRWCFNQFLQDRYTVYPLLNFIQNIGLDSAGTHGSLRKDIEESLVESYNIEFSNDVKLNEDILKSFSKHYNLQPYNYIGFLLKRIGLYKSVKRFIKK